MKTALPLGPIEDERTCRIRAIAGLSGDAQQLFAESLAQAPTLDWDRIDRARRFALERAYDHPGMTTAAYLEHPFRVASLTVELDPGLETDTLVIALLHNVLEVSDSTVQDLSAQFGDEPATVIADLTVDRARPTDEYRELYYSRLAAGARSGMVVKVIDKLDNLFTLCLNPDARVRADYLAEVERWIVPMTYRELPALAEYFLALVEDCRVTGHWDLAPER